MPSTVRIEPNTLGQPALPYVATGAPPGTFDRPGTAIDSDGLMGTPAELQAQKPDPLDTADGGDWIAGSGVSPPPDALAEEREQPVRTCGRAWSHPATPSKRSTARLPGASTSPGRRTRPVRRPVRVTRSPR